MSGSLNKVMLIGNLGTDVKIVPFENGQCLGTFSIATNESYNNKQTGEKVVNTEWHDVVVRNKAAELCKKYLKKGDKVYVEGKLKKRKWKGDDGVQRYSTEVHVSEFNFLSNRNDMSGSPSPSPNPEPTPPANTMSSPPSSGSSDNSDESQF